MQAHGGVKGGRSHGGDALDETLGISDGDRATGGGDLCGAEQTENQGDTKSWRAEVELTAHVSEEEPIWVLHLRWALDDCLSKWVMAGIWNE